VGIITHVSIEKRGIDMKPKDIIYYYEIKINFDKDKIEQKQQNHRILGANDFKIVIDDREFTTIQLKKLYRSDHATLFNEVRVYESKFEGYWDYIESHLYSATSSKKIAFRRIKKALEKFIYQKHGRYCNAITLLNQVEI